jgi:hypothetical protein
MHKFNMSLCACIFDSDRRKDEKIISDGRKFLGGIENMKKL